MTGKTLKRHAPLLFLTLVFLISGSLLSTWTIEAQDGVLPLPGLSSNRAFLPVQQLTASDGAAGEYFGLKVELDGDTLLEGSNIADGTGAAYIFERSASGTWNEVKRLTGSDTAAGDDFAFDVALQGDTAVVGAPGHTTITDDEGALYLFNPNGAGVWTETQKLSVPNMPPNAYLGSAVDIDGDRIMAGAEGIDKTYIFKRDVTGGWQLETDIDTGEEVYDVKILGDTALIGSAFDSTNTAGAVYLYQLQAGSWTFVKKLIPSDGVAGDNFGYKVLLYNDQAFVFSFLSVSGTYRGAVYVYSRNGGAWDETQKITPNDAADNDNFGFGMAADGETLVISSYGDSGNAGSAYQFGWNGSAWVQQDKILPVGGRFGTEVDFQGSVLVSGAPFADNQKGKVYVYSNPNLIPTPTTEPVTELLVDGSFENNATGWDIKDATGDKVKCNQEGKVIAHTGECAWRFKGGKGENAKIQQVITGGADQGDSLRLSGFVNASGTVDSKVKIVVSYADASLEKSKITVNIASETSSYQPLSSFQPSLTTSVTAPVEKIKVQLKNSSTSGKVYYDDLSLAVES